MLGGLLQARGEHNLRHFDRYVWLAPIPLYYPADLLHRQLVDLGQRAAEVAAAVELPNMSFQALRRRVPTALAEADSLGNWEPSVAQLLGQER